MFFHFSPKFKKKTKKLVKHPVNSQKFVHKFQLNRA